MSTVVNTPADSPTDEAGIRVSWMHVSGSHGHIPRGTEVPSGSTFKPGMFGRLFPDLPRFEPGDEALVALGEAMVDPRQGQLLDAAGNNDAVPAGFTYLGQFIDHDVTLDLTSLGEKNTDPQATINFRTPSLDLDCLYLLGPNGSPYLYQRNDKDLFELGLTGPSTGGEAPDTPLPNDLPRGPNGFALIGDHRNDENLIVAQLHVAMLKFHNAVVARVRQAGPPPELNVFAEARRIVRWHYQWIVIHDFLMRVADPAVVNDVLDNGRTFYSFGEFGPFIPVEFSVAAYRFGHSMVREDYSYNRNFAPQGPPVPPDQQGLVFSSPLGLLFEFTGLSGTTQPAPINWVIDWRRFFAIPGAEQFLTTPTRKINALLTEQLHELPGPPDMSASLAARNLLRGKKMGLPTGQAVAGAMGMQDQILTQAELGSGPDGAVAATHGFDVNSPLWWYLLKEAEVKGGGAHLGPVGSRIVAEVFVGLLDGDPSSFRRQQPGWTPELPAATAGTFTMADLLTFVNEINPLG